MVIMALFTTFMTTPVLAILQKLCSREAEPAERRGLAGKSVSLATKTGRQEGADGPG